MRSHGVISVDGVQARLVLHKSITRSYDLGERKKYEGVNVGVVTGREYVDSLQISIGGIS